MIAVGHIEGGVPLRTCPGCGKQRPRDWFVSANRACAECFKCRDRAEGRPRPQTPEDMAGAHVCRRGVRAR